MNKLIDKFIKTIKLINDPRAIIIAVISLILVQLIGFKISLAAILIILLNGAINGI